MNRTTVSKWGNSAAVRIPKAIVDELGIKPGQTLDISVRDGRAIMEPVKQHAVPTLAQIIAEMERLGPEREPPTVEWGPDRGSERLENYD